MSSKYCVLLVAFGLGVGACAGTQVKNETPSGMAEIVVLAYTGLTRPEGRIIPPPIHLVADMTSLAGPSGKVEAGPDEQLALARRLSLGLLPIGIAPESLSLLPFDRLGERPPSQCTAPRGSWATSALARLRTRLEAQTEPAPRVILIADIERECEPDLCQAGRELLDAGGWLDVVSLGSAVPPACLRELRPDAARPGPRVRELTGGPPRFHVERPDAGSGKSDRLAEGVADGEPVRVPAGLVRVIIELDDEAAVGPFSIAPGERARVRIQSFPLSARNEQSWVVDTQKAF